ncbi:MAG TPA: DUF2339 domain-containing protein [Rhodocyclaceae bacterium]|nr:DUF2339 domain-containing protein [Rhodocyclaceae bacterium]
MPFIGLIVGVIFGMAVGGVSDAIALGIFSGAMMGWLLGLLYNSRLRLHKAETRLTAIEAALDLKPGRNRAAASITPTEVSQAHARDIATEVPVARPDEPATTAITSAPANSIPAPAAPSLATPAPALPLQPVAAQAIVTTPAADAVTQTSTPIHPVRPVRPIRAQETEREAEKNPQPEPARRSPFPVAGPSPIELAFKAARNWLFGGNTLVRMGAVLVFLGLAFLLRYASDRVVIPLELRYLGVAVTSLVALGLGWRLREKRRAYGLLMQGAAVAVMYLTIFAAMKLPDVPLIPATVGFVLLVGVGVLAAILAVLQDAKSLAVAGSLGGFAAPVLASTGGGSHVALFSYFALLNAGIFGIAWFKAWRALNLIGFFGTFLIGLAWGLRSYQPEDYATTQPFLVLFFLMFVGIGLLFARRVLLDDPDVPKSKDTADWLNWIEQSGHKAQRYVDATLLFGAPLVGFGLQYSLVGDTQYGAAFSALALGGFYMLLARLVFARHPIACRLLTEVFLALGVVFASLAMPLGLDAKWTSAAWAVEAAGIYWIGHRQQRPLARAFALLLQIGAICALLSDLAFSIPSSSLIEGSALGAGMLGLALLANMVAHRWHITAEFVAAQHGVWDAELRPVFSTLGLWFLYLIAPLSLQADDTATAWALASVATVFIGLRLRERAWVGNALLLQLLAGVLFLLRVGEGSTEGVVGGVLSISGSGFKGLFIAGLAGLSSLVSIGMAVRAARAREDDVLVRRLAWMMLFGLTFLVLAVLFVLPWATATAVWAASGVLLFWVAIRLSLKPALLFALVLEAVAGFAFFADIFPSLAWNADPAIRALPAFANSGFWTPVVIALSAFAVAWRLHAFSRRAPEKDGNDNPLLTQIALLWSAAWWAFAWGLELERVLAIADVRHAFLGAMASSALLALWIARRRDWAQLVGLCAMLLPLGALLVWSDYTSNMHPFGNWGAPAWGATLLAVVALLHVTAGRLSAFSERACHLFAAWLVLLVTALELRHVFILLSEPNSAWRWLGWSLPLVGYLLWSARSSAPRLWPARAHPDIYRRTATLPVAIILLVWQGFSTALSSGNAMPLPYIPLINPLEIAQVLVLFASCRWLKDLQDEEVSTAQSLAPLLLRALQVGAFLLYTCGVLRAVHHLAGVSYDVDALMASMLVQASLSIAWSLLALGLMIAGHRLHRRGVWITGAVLVAAVVGKLFLIELSNRGGLERIVSFIGVGILLLVVGYFAPLPPRVEDTADATPTDPATEALNRA